MMVSATQQAMMKWKTKYTTLAKIQYSIEKW
jgi:hypothetical protein